MSSGKSIYTEVNIYDACRKGPQEMASWKNGAWMRMKLIVAVVMFHCHVSSWEGKWYNLRINLAMDHRHRFDPSDCDNENSYNHNHNFHHYCHTTTAATTTTTTTATTATTTTTTATATTTTTTTLGPGATTNFFFHLLLQRLQQELHQN